MSRVKEKKNPRRIKCFPWQTLKALNAAGLHTLLFLLTQQWDNRGCGRSTLTQWLWLLVKSSRPQRWRQQPTTPCPTAIPRFDYRPKFQQLSEAWRLKMGWMTTCDRKIYIYAEAKRRGAPSWATAVAQQLKGHLCEWSPVIADPSLLYLDNAGSSADLLRLSDFQLCFFWSFIFRFWPVKQHQRGATTS